MLGVPNDPQSRIVLCRILAVFSVAACMATAVAHASNECDCSQIVGQCDAFAVLVDQRVVEELFEPRELHWQVRGVTRAPQCARIQIGVRGVEGAKADLTMAGNLSLYRRIVSGGSVLISDYQRVSDPEVRVTEANDFARCEVCASRQAEFADQGEMRDESIEEPSAQLRENSERRQPADVHEKNARHSSIPDKLQELDGILEEVVDEALVEANEHARESDRNAAKQLAGGPRFDEYRRSTHATARAQSASQWTALFQTFGAGLAIPQHSRASSNIEDASLAGCSAQAEMRLQESLAGCDARTRSMAGLCETARARAACLREATTVIASCPPAMEMARTIERQLEETAATVCSDQAGAPQQSAPAARGVESGKDRFAGCQLHTGGPVHASEIQVDFDTGDAYRCPSGAK